MAYNGGCLIGVCDNTTTTIYANQGTAPADITAAQNNTLTNVTSWPAQDGAWVPYKVAKYSLMPPGNMSHWVAKNSGLGLSSLANSILAMTNRGSSGITAFFQGPSSFSGFASFNNGTKIWTTGEGVYSEQAEGRRFLAMGLNGTTPIAMYTSGGSFAVSGSWDIYAGEFCQAYCVELPNNQELTAYRRSHNAPSMVEIKTLDGAVRRAKTGQPSTEISATFKWSDNGTIASAVNTILNLAKDWVQPIIVYIPPAIYYNGPFLDLVIPSNNPTITMPTPGVYELTIEGTCQP